MRPSEDYVPPLHRPDSGTTVEDGDSEPPSKTAAGPSGATPDLRAGHHPAAFQTTVPGPSGSVRTARNRPCTGRRWF